nr:DUF5597 domain-containing protein [Lacticaseibacillus camelliae]
MTIPHLQDNDGQTVLMVDDKPFIGLAAECHNSSASSTAYMNTQVWPRVLPLNINTLLVPVYWEMIEPKPDRFDFSSVQDLISEAREHQVKLVLLWFGLWKNGLSSYVPGWLKEDSTVRYAQKRDGQHLYSISPADQTAVDLDAKAFGHLMAFIKKTDTQQSTVIMVQVENEVGLLDADFDYSVAKGPALNRPLPDVFGAAPAATWQSQFGPQAGEYYMAFLYASALQTIAAAGKAQYALPMYVNAWLEKPLGRPGAYPTGGPTVKMLPLWQKVATAVDLVAPDLYVPNFEEVSDAYAAPQQALLVPETRQDLRTVSNLIYAISHYNLLLFSPFGAEDFFNQDVTLDAHLLKAVAIDADAFDWSKTGSVLAKAYALLAGMLPLIVQKRQQPQMHSFLISQAADRGRRIKLASCEAAVHFVKQEGNVSPSAGFILELSENEFLLFGLNISVNLSALSQSERWVDQPRRRHLAGWSMACWSNPERRRESQNSSRGDASAAQN